MENYCYSLKNSVNDEKLQDKISSEDKETITKNIENTLSWLDDNQTGEVEDYDTKQKELEGIMNPILQNMYASVSGATGATEDVTADSHPVEELD